jgi:hypothetical protein
MVVHAAAPTLYTAWANSSFSWVDKVVEASAAGGSPPDCAASVAIMV